MSNLFILITLSLGSLKSVDCLPVCLFVILKFTCNRCSIRIIHICVFVSHARKRDYSISLQLLSLTHICYLPVVILTVVAEVVVVVLFEPEAK